ncbi:ADP-ribose pyrophosphatase YjhB (NUDIX family) [Actinopolymorpha rutila]|uniref:ADP-ribose pyrophosphatase YjhB (NUDIX family) n=1 Tax=Actinopolymorpha rutila TaxID=446787 RepID=A0A852ZVR8_9ACTN|nr:ADP-ribose pyrophosphatase YjhB (NUDIX family) [Actinopolymorpha rutila]
MLRELAEETGLKGVVRRLIGVHSNVYGSAEDSIHGVRLLYQVTANDAAARPERDDTTDDARWFTRDAADALDLSEHARYGVGLLAGRTGSSGGTGATQVGVDRPARRPS